MRMKFFVCDAMAGRQCFPKCCLLSEEADSTSHLPKNLNLMTVNDDRSLLSVPTL